MSERFSASNASKHMACHASANLDLAIPGWVPPVEDPTAKNAANKGTRLHEVLAELVEMGPKEMVNFAKALDYIAEVMRGRRFKKLIEQPMQATWLRTQPWTTADLVLYTQDELHVIDYKNGKTPVPVDSNEQLMFYAVTYGHLAPRAKGANLHIVQPAADNMECWWSTATELAAFMQAARRAEQQIQQGDTTFKPGDHCMFCPANPRSRAQKGKPLCPALMDLYYPKTMDEEEILNG